MRFVTRSWFTIPKPNARRSAVAAEGNAYQTVTIVPSHDLVVVRLGELHSYDYAEIKGKVGALIQTFPSIDAAPEPVAAAAGGAP